MAALPFCFIYPQSEGQKILGPRFALGDGVLKYSITLQPLEKKSDKERLLGYLKAERRRFYGSGA